METDSKEKTNIFVRTKNAAEKCFSAIWSKPALSAFIAAFILNIIIEMLSRHSFTGGIMFIFTNPIAFLLGVSIICVTLIPSFFIKKRSGVALLVLVLWLAMGVTNFIVTSNRLTPFSAMDITIARSIINLIKIYFNVWEVILIALAIIVAVGLIVFFFIKIPSEKIKWKRSLLSGCKLLIVFGLALFTAFQSGAVSARVPSLDKAYRSYGFMYCFSASIFSRGISRPSDYSPEAVKEIYNQLDNESGSQSFTAKEQSPNIILLQLESFYDAKNFKGYEFSEDPIPNFTKMMENGPHGTLTVPSIGGGTANTEFEVLTGMDKEHFGIGEYPYKTILQDSTCESICYNLKNSDYTCHAIHNHIGTFYERYKVFKNLGFDTFTSSEYMTYVPFAQHGWEKDEILPRYIDAALKSTEGKDFVFTITVQGHGAYQFDDSFEPEILVSSTSHTESERAVMEYYSNMLHETDMMLGELIKTYENSSEPIMIIVYGDHLPNFDSMSEDELKENTLLQTEYAVWTNYDLGTKEERNLTAYQLSAYILQLCGKNDGIITKVHQTYSDSYDYEYILEMLEYSMLYDNSNVEEIRTRYEPTEMKLGILDIAISGINLAYQEEDGATVQLVKGSNFTNHSVVLVNGKEVRTAFKNPSTLIVDAQTFVPGDIITVAQKTENFEYLTHTEEYTVPDEQ